MIPEVQEVLPYVVGAASVGAAGALLEASAKRNIRANQEAFVEEHGQIAEQQPSGRLRKFGGAILVVGTAFGIVGGLHWRPESDVHTIPPRLQIVVDHSGATALGKGSAAREITQLVSQFENNDEINAQAFLASGGEVTPTLPQDVAKDLPGGNAPLYEATKSAVKQASLNKAGIVNSETSKSNGVLILSNGNRVEPSKDVIASAQKNYVPVFVVNVEAKKTEADTTKQLQEIAKQTHGKYWNANDKSIDEISKVVKDTLVPQDINTKDRPSPWPKRIAELAIAGLTMGYLFKNRKKMPTGIGIK